MKKACQIHDGRVRDGDMMIERRSGKMRLGRYKINTYEPLEVRKRGGWKCGGI